MSKCESCPHLAKCQQKIANLTPEEKKKLCYKLWKKKVLLKLDEHKTRMKLLSIPLIPFQIPFYFVSNALRKKQMISMMNLRLKGLNMMKKIDKRKSHNYVSPERKTKRKTKAKRKRKRKRNESK